MFPCVSAFVLIHRYGCVLIFSHFPFFRFSVPEYDFLSVFILMFFNAFTLFLCTLHHVCLFTEAPECIKQARSLGAPGASTTSWITACCPAHHIVHRGVPFPPSARCSAAWSPLPLPGPSRSPGQPVPSPGGRLPPPPGRSPAQRPSGNQRQGGLRTRRNPRANSTLRFRSSY